MSAVVSGLIGGLIASVLVTVAMRTQKRARMNAEGWRTLRAGWLLNVTILGCAGLSVLMAYSLLSGGSSRPDADTQNIYTLILFMLFGLGAAYVGWTTHGHTVMWKGNELCTRTSFGRETVRSISDVRRVKKIEMLGEYRLEFRDGSTLRISSHFHGAEELVSSLPVTAL